MVAHMILFFDFRPALVVSWFILLVFRDSGEDQGLCGWNFYWLNEWDRCGYCFCILVKAHDSLRTSAHFVTIRLGRLLFWRTCQTFPYEMFRFVQFMMSNIRRCSWKGMSHFRKWIMALCGMFSMMSPYPPASGALHSCIATRSYP